MQDLIVKSKLLYCLHDSINRQSLTSLICLVTPSSQSIKFKENLNALKV